MADDYWLGKTALPTVMKICHASIVFDVYLTASILVDSNASARAIGKLQPNTFRHLLNDITLLSLGGARRLVYDLRRTCHSDFRGMLRQRA